MRPDAVRLAQASDPNSESFTVIRHYPFTRIRSWTNEGFYVVLETVTKAMQDELYKFKFASNDDAAALVEAIQVCLAALMKRLEEEKAAKKAAKAKAASQKAATSAAAAPAPTPPPKKPAATK